MARRPRRFGTSVLLERAGRCAALGGALLVATSCAAGVPDHGGPSTLGPATPTARAGQAAAGRHAATVNGVPTRQRRSAPEPSAAGRTPGAAGPDDAAIEHAWLAETNAFYVASERGDPSYPPLVAGVIPGGPAEEQALSFISAQAASGVVGPSTWRLGNVVVSRRAGATAVVTACAFDPGSHLKANGLPAPAPLGGGAGLTAFVTDMTEVNGTWKVDKSVTSAPRSTDSPGPCRGF